MEERDLQLLRLVLKVEAERGALAGEEEDVQLLAEAKADFLKLMTEALVQAMDKRDLKQLRTAVKIAEKEANVEEAVLLKAKSVLSELVTEALQKVMNGRNLDSLRLA